MEPGGPFGDYLIMVLFGNEAIFIVLNDIGALNGVVIRLLQHNFCHLELAVKL